MKRREILLLAIACLVMGAVAGQAQTRDQVVESMKARFPELTEAKNRGQVGEAWSGLAGLVDSSAPDAVKQMVENENRDRRSLFQMIARETGSSLEEVARQNRIRMYRLADDHHFVQDSNRRWVRRKDLQ